MFFWLYALDQFLALFLDAGIIPSSHEIYPVRSSFRLGRAFSQADVAWFVCLVVCCDIHRLDHRDVLEFDAQWFRWFPSCRRRHASVFMGARISRSRTIRHGVKCCSFSARRSCV